MRYVKPFIGLALLVFAFWYSGPGQPFVAALAAWVGIGALIPPTPNADFHPYHVRIYPTIAALKAHGILSGSEADNVRDGLLRRSRIRLTVLKPKKFDQAPLLYWSDKRSFGTRFERSFGFAVPVGSDMGGVQAASREFWLNLGATPAGLTLRIGSPHANLERILRERVTLPWSALEDAEVEHPERTMRDLKAHAWTMELGATTVLHHEQFTAYNKHI